MVSENYELLYKINPYDGFLNCLISKCWIKPKLLLNYIRNILLNLIYIILAESILLIGVAWEKIECVLICVFVIVLVFVLSRILNERRCWLWKRLYIKCYKCYLNNQIQKRVDEQRMLDKVLLECAVKQSSEIYLKDLMQRNIRNFNILENTIKTILFSFTSKYVYDFCTYYFGINITNIFAVQEYSISLAVLIVAAIVALAVLIFEFNKHPLRWKQFWSQEALRLIEYRLTV